MRKKAGVSDHLNFHILLLFSIQHPSNLQQGCGTHRCLAAWHRGGSLGIYLLLRLTCNSSSFFECHLVLTLRKPRCSCSRVPHRIPKLGCFSTVPMMDSVFSLMNLPSPSPLIYLLPSFHVLLLPPLLYCLCFYAFTKSNVLS